MLSDLSLAEHRSQRATEMLTTLWEKTWGDDELLLSVPGMGPLIAPTVRAFFGDAKHFDTAKQAQAFVGLNPSNWSSGQMESHREQSPKKGPEFCG